MENPQNNPETAIVPTNGTFAPDALQTTAAGNGSIYASKDSFAHGQRIAQALAASTMVPKPYQNNVPNCLVALELANRMRLSALAVMQNIDIIHDRPCWKSTFIVSAINSCGKFFGLRYELSGEGDARSCYAYAKSREDGLIVRGPGISVATAKKQGWYSKSGSKWPDMTDLMLMYRAATFFGRLYAPELLNGMQTAEETFDVGFDVVASGAARRDALNAKLTGRPAPTATAYEAVDAEVVLEDIGI